MVQNYSALGNMPPQRSDSLCSGAKASISSSQTAPQRDKTSRTCTCMSSRAFAKTDSGFGFRATTHSDREQNSTPRRQRYGKHGHGGTLLNAQLEARENEARFTN